MYGFSFGDQFDGRTMDGIGGGRGAMSTPSRLRLSPFARSTTGSGSRSPHLAGGRLHYLLDASSDDEDEIRSQLHTADADQEEYVPDPACVLSLPSPRSPLSVSYYYPGSSQLNLRYAARRRPHQSSTASTPWPALAARQLACEEDDDVLVMDGVLLPVTGSSRSHLLASQYSSSSSSSSSSPLRFPGGESSSRSGTGLGALSAGGSSDLPPSSLRVPAWRGFADALSCALSSEFGEPSSGSGVTWTNQHGDPKPVGGEETRYTADGWEPADDTPTPTGIVDYGIPADQMSHVAEVKTVHEPAASEKASAVTTSTAAVPSSVAATPPIEALPESVGPLSVGTTVPPAAASPLFPAAGSNPAAPTLPAATAAAAGMDIVAAGSSVAATPVATPSWASSSFASEVASPSSGTAFVTRAAMDRSEHIWAHWGLRVPQTSEKDVYPLTEEQAAFADRVVSEQSPRPRLQVFVDLTETQEPEEAPSPTQQRPGQIPPPLMAAVSSAPQQPPATPQARNSTVPVPPSTPQPSCSGSAAGSGFQSNLKASAPAFEPKGRRSELRAPLRLLNQ